MKYDFDKLIDRKNTSCLKYDFAERYGRSDGLLPLWIADMDFRTPEVVLDAIRARLDHGIFGYTSPDQSYFRVVSRWFERRHGWSPRPEAFVNSCGVVFALGALLRVVTEREDGVIICQPVYYPFEKIVRGSGRKLVVSQLQLADGHYGIDFEDFEKKIVENGVKAFIMCSPHNPVGRVWTRAELERIGDICMRHGVFVISDEIHADFAFDGHRHLPFASVREEFADRCAVCTAPSKTFNIAGLQVSNIYISDDGVRAAYERELDSLGYGEPNVLGLTACVAAYEHGAEWLDELKGYLKDNFDFLRAYLKENLPEIVLIEPEGTYLAWLDCRALHLSDEELEALMGRAGLWLDDGYIFGEGGSGFERMNLACPRAVLKTALERLKSAIKR